MDFAYTQSGLGCLNPIGRSEDFAGISPQSRVPNLSDLVAKQLVKHIEWTRSALCVCPRTVIPNLLRGALNLGRDLSIQLLVQNWPYDCLHLEELEGRPLLPKLSAYFSENQLMEELKLSLTLTAALVAAFVTCLKSPDTEPQMCKTLNLVGFTSADAVILYLAANCKLIENFRLQSMMYNKVSQLMAGQPSQHSLPTHASSGHLHLPTRRYTIRFDARVTGNDLCKTLRQALVISSQEESRLALETDKLDLSSLQDRQVIGLLNSVKSDLQGLSISVCRFNDNLLRELCFSLPRFDRLVSLRLSYLVTARPDELITHLGSTVAQLPNLRRLDLSAILFRGRLEEVLLGLTGPLTYLNLSACCLRAKDYDFLASDLAIPLRQSLQDLILNDNTMQQAYSPVPSLVSCLNAGWSKLEVFQLTGAHLIDPAFISVTRALARGTRRLKLIDLSVNPAHSEALASSVEVLVTLPSLRHLKLSVPADCFSDEDADLEGMLDLERHVEFRRRIEAVCERTYPHLNIVFADWS